MRKRNKPKSKAYPKKSRLREYTEALLTAVIAALLIRTFVVQAYRIPSGSMEDTLLVGDFLLVNKFIYGARIPFIDIHLPAIRKPEPGDVVVFQYPEDPSKDFIKRCIAVAGQTVEIRNKQVLVDGRLVPLPPTGKHIDPNNILGRDKWGPKTVPPYHLFVLGDNRDNSRDSRSWGFLRENLLRGEALIIYWSWHKAPGDPTLSINWNDPLYSLSSLVWWTGFNLVHIPWRVRWRRIGKLIR